MKGLCCRTEGSPPSPSPEPIPASGTLPSGGTYRGAYLLREPTIRTRVVGGVLAVDLAFPTNAWSQRGNFFATVPAASFSAPTSHATVVGTDGGACTAACLVALNADGSLSFSINSVGVNTSGPLVFGTSFFFSQ